MRICHAASLFTNSFGAWIDDRRIRINEALARIVWMKDLLTSRLARLA